MPIRIEQIDRDSLNKLLATDEELKNLIGVDRSALITKLSALTPEELTALGIESLAPTEHNHDDRYYTETEADTKFATKSELEQLGPGDMGTFIYDPDKDGVVVAAETANHVAWDNVSEKPNLLILSDDPSTEPYISNTDLLDGHPASYFAEDSVVQDHIEDTGAHGLNTGIINNPALVFGANTIKHTGKAPVYPEIEFVGIHYVNMLGKDGDCESLTNYITSSNVVDSLDSTIKVFGNNSIKLTLTADAATYGYIKPVLTLDKYYFVSGYVRNGNTSGGIRLRVLNVGDMTLADNPYITDATKFVRQGVKMKPTDFADATETRIALTVSGLNGEYAYFDGLMCQEITADEYNTLTVDQLLAKYPYVESYGVLANPYFENRRGNLIRNGNCEEGTRYWISSDWTKINIENNYFKADGTNGYGYFNQKISAKQGDIFTLYAKGYKYSGEGTASLRVDFFDATGTVISGYGKILSFNQVESTLTGFTSAAPANTAWIYIYPSVSPGTVLAFKEVMLIKGTIAPTEYISCDLQRFAIEGQFTSDDKVVIKDGKVSGLKYWKHNTLYGKDYDWTYYLDFTGYKEIKVPNPVNTLSSSGYTGQPHKLIKYNGCILNYASPNNAGDNFCIYNDGYTYISISDINTGWAESIAPNNDEVKAFMNGWKAVNNNGTRYVAWVNIIDNSLPAGALQTTVSVAYTSGGATLTLASVVGFAVNDSFIVVSGGSYFFRNITAINGNVITLSSSIPVNVASSDVIFKCDNATNTSLVAWCKNNVAPGYEGYRLHYKLANPEPITDVNTSVEGGIWNITPGDNYITVNSGMVLSEIANPYLVGGAYYLNRVDKGGVMLQNKAEDIIALYKNDMYDSNWAIYSDGTVAYGKGCASILTANYNTNAIYTVDYQILKQLHAQSFSNLTVKYGQDVFTAIETIGKAVEEKQQHNSVLDKLVDLSIYEEIKAFTYSSRALKHSSPTNGCYIQGSYFYKIPKVVLPVVTIMPKTVAYVNDSGSLITIDLSKINFTATSVSRDYIRITAFYIGNDSAIMNYFVNNGGYFTVDIIADCRERL